MTETTIITENLTDGSTTVIEVITTDENALSVEEIIEALTDEPTFEPELDEDAIESETDAADLTADVDVELASDPIAEEVFSDGEFHLASDEIAAEVFNNGEFHLASDGIAAEVFGGSPNGTTYEEMAQSAGYEVSVPDTSTNALTVEGVTDTINETSNGEQADPASIEAAAHLDAARAAQEAADEFVARGDYAAAAEAREVAENEAWEAGDNSMLGMSDSSDLEYAAYKQENAEYHQEQQAIHAQQGNYEAAREDASNAAYAVQDADWYAGGADHSGQAQAEETQLDWAVWEEQNADYYAESATQSAAAGDVDSAEYYAAEAVEHQDAADYYGDLGEHGGDMAVYDSSTPAVETGGSYEPDVAE
jgi:hypothetical protein